MYETADISPHQQLPPFCTYDSWPGSRSLFPVLGPHSCVARTVLARGSVCVNCRGMTGSKHGRRSQISDLNVFPLWIMLLFMRVVSQCVICRITHADHLTFTICFSFLYLKRVFQLRCSGGFGHDLNPVLSDRACFHFTSL